MRVIVFSDSHGMLGNAETALMGAGRVDLILHAGDYFYDALRLAETAGLPFKTVRGNCERMPGGVEEELVELNGHLILLTHGHFAPPGKRYEKLLARAGEYGAGVVVFGHTHVVEVLFVEGVLLFNPGSISRPRDRQDPSYGILEVDENGVRPYIYRV